MKSLREYQDYRKYLRDFYKTKKKANPWYSFRMFSRIAGFKACNMLKLVMDGDRNLTEDSMKKFAKALGLSEEDTCWFQDMVRKNQT